MIWAFLLYYLVCYVVSYILVEFGQKLIYDEVTPLVAIKVGGGALVMAAFLTWLRPSLDTMFTTYLPQTVIMAIAWVGVFILVYRFQPWHGLAIGLAAVLLLPGLATMAVQGLTTPRPDPRTQFTTPAKPLRKGSAVNLGVPPVPAR